MSPVDPPGGMRCSEVLAKLSEFLDGGLAAGERGAIEAHVRVCPDCTRFGGVFATVLGRFRQELRADPDAGRAPE